jgi:protein ImuB
MLRRLEAIGAEVESPRPGEAFFAVDGLRTIWGPGRRDVLARAARAVGMPAKVAGAPSRFCARAAATTARGRGRAIRVVAPGSERSFLAPLPVSLLDGGLGGREGRDEARARGLIATLERLGVGSLGDLAGLPRVAIADRFGALGLRAHDLACGLDTPLRPRVPHEDLVQAIGLPEAAYGVQLERALDLLLERLLSDPRRRGRAIRSLALEARLAGGGGWSATAVLRSASAAPERLRAALSPKLGALTAPATTLALRAIELAPEAGAQPALAEDPGEQRRERLGEAVRQARAAAGSDAVLRVLEIDPGSRVPERWVALAPVNE